MNNFSLSIEGDDVASGSAYMHYDIDISDDLSGIGYVNITLESPSGQSITVSQLSGLGDTVHSLSLDSEFFDQYAEEGDWTINYIVLKDNAGNSSEFIRATDLAAAGLPYQVTVTNSSN